ncbi:hypothetical protein EVAR_41468_1 [Eumeta japonica]|uniref:Uncharacterized protein n=1 Tax=Eumeta variegata TaxID=151549 RepID=A0A4C1X1K1_EUMVA|nr:hypothetical protein EVAR_41468_1 [Eumeta japonica]
MPVEPHHVAAAPPHFIRSAAMLYFRGTEHVSCELGCWNGVQGIKEVKRKAYFNSHSFHMAIERAISRSRSEMAAGGNRAPTADLIEEKTTRPFTRATSAPLCRDRATAHQRAGTRT